MKKELLLLILVIFHLNLAFGQFSLEEFLGTSRNDLSLNPSQAKLDFLKENNFNGPWINRVEVRTRSNDANFSQEDFRFRLTPGNPGELKANKRYYDKQVDLLNIEYHEELNEALVFRYSLAIDHIFKSGEQSNLLKQLEINRQLIAMISNSSGAYNLDIGDLIDAESDELDIKLEIENTKIGMLETEYLIKEFYEYSGELDWSKTGLIEIDDILNLFAEFKDKTTGQHINLVRLDKRQALAAERYNIEKSESLRNIGYFQAEYDTERGDEAKDHFGYQIGIRIPIVNPDKAQLNRRKLAIMDDQAIMEREKDEYRRNLELAVLRMDHYATQHAEIQAKLKIVSQQNYLALNSPGKSIKIADLIKMNEFYNELLVKKNEVEKNIYNTYIEYLNLSGKLSELPMRNYLSKNLTVF